MPVILQMEFSKNNRCNSAIFLGGKWCMVWKGLYSSLIPTTCQLCGIGQVSPLRQAPFSSFVRGNMRLQSVAVHTFNSSTGEAEPGASLDSRPAWYTNGVQMASQKNKTHKTGKNAFNHQCNSSIQN